MPTVKDKIALCHVGLADFSVESVNEVPFYKRYFEFSRLFAKIIPSVDFESRFAQPQENTIRKIIEWYYIPGNESPIKLSEIKKNSPELYNSCVQQRQEIISQIRAALVKATENEQKYLDAVLVNLEEDYVDSITYCYDDHVLFGVWGMITKIGRQIDSVITESVLDHRAYKIIYQVEGSGSIKPFSSVNRRHGHVLQGDRDIPQVIPDPGFYFKAWVPDAPYGRVVKADLVFTAVCEKKDDTSEGSGSSTSTPPIGDGRNRCHVHFNAGEHGAAMGTTDFELLAGERMPHEAVPSISPKDGYRFVGWDKTPDNYIVYEDTEFFAQYEEIVKDEETTPFIVQFNEGEHGTLHGQTHYEKHDGDKVVSAEVPTVEAEEGYRFIGWDKDPNGFVVHEDVEFTALYKESKKSWWASFWGWGSGCLNWLLSLLLLGLIGLLLWYLLAGYRNFNFCGCDCPEQLVPLDDEDKNKEISCDEVSKSGGYGKTIQPVNLGQSSGIFQFDYNTYSVIDEITIYNGKSPKGKPIFHYKGGTMGVVSEKVSYNSPDGYITVIVQGFESGTDWNFKVNCPESDSRPDPSVVHDGDDLPKPEKNCGVHFSGAILSDETASDRGISKIFSDDIYGEYVGSGYYPDNTKTFPKAVRHTFDAIAVDNGTHLILYSEPDFKGKVLLDVVGPMLISNIAYQSGDYQRAVNKTFSPDLQTLFPPSRRQWSSSNMHDWSNGSCKIICE